MQPSLPRRGAAKRAAAGRPRSRDEAFAALMARRRPTDHALGSMRIVVDNSAGGDAQLADDVTRSLTAQGMEVELRPADPAAIFDTSVHLVSAGIVIRVFERPDPATLRTIESAIRAALVHRPSLRRRTRSVPVQLAETHRVLEWIDVFD
jgi:hypothetical protein